MVDQINSFLFKLMKPAPSPARLSCDESGLVITCDKRGVETSVAIHWQDVSKLVAFKRDCFGVDLICVLIGIEASTFEVNEEFIGWTLFLEAAQQNVPGMLSFEVWWPQVAFPAFETNPTIVFDRVEVKS